ncbi:MAG TPA: phosphoglycerate dehydrogenase [Pirellulales bacterium]|jgi:D-3-phosphoglycerate dehydrogenase|nr:phosphoglycerate dehydrogenase [Pirellulales bacterium]
MPRIIVLDTLSPDGLALLDAAKPKGIEYEVRTGLKGDALRDALAEFDGAICRSGVKITPDALAGNHRLKAIVRAGVGTDNIDKEAATRLGIVVMNTPAGNTLSTAEHTFAMMLALSRNIAPAYQSLVEHKWDRNKFMGAQLADKTLGVVGLGRVGLAVARRAKAFEMRVLGYDPFLARERAQELGIEPFDNVRQMLPEVDYLTVHTPLTDETKNLISRAEIETMRPSVRLVNCARGGIYDEAALAEALKAKRIAGVALDVFASEPCTDSPLFGMPGVLATPHLGASTEEAQAQVAVEGVGLLVDFLTTGAIRHAVNMSPLDRQTLESLRGFLDVAHRLGLLLAQMDKATPQRCVLHYRGEVAGKNTRLITAAFAVGLLENALVADVNIVNAELLLRERGIELIEQSRADMGAFSSVITAEVVTAASTHRAAGTLLGQNMPRLVQVADHRLESYLDGVLLVFTHRDVPGIIGRVGTIFGQHKINIAQMAVGRAAPGGAATGVLNLDTEPTAAALAEVLASPDIESATVIRLPPAGKLPAWLQ